MCVFVCLCVCIGWFRNNFTNYRGRLLTPKQGENIPTYVLFVAGQFHGLHILLTSFLWIPSESIYHKPIVWGDPVDKNSKHWCRENVQAMERIHMSEDVYMDFSFFPSFWTLPKVIKSFFLITLYIMNQTTIYMMFIHFIFALPNRTSKSVMFGKFLPCLLKTIY